MQPSFQGPNSKPDPHPNTSNISTYATSKVSSQLQTFDGIDYRYHLITFWVVVGLVLVWQLGPGPTISKQYRIWNLGRLNHFATYLDCLVSTWFATFYEADTGEWSPPF